MITVYTFGNLPAFAMGVTRDLRVLWAFEEVERQYNIHAIDARKQEQRGTDYHRINPFGLIPAIDDDGFKLFESAAIVSYITEGSNLMPRDTRQQAAAMQWTLAALSTVEPATIEIFGIDHVHSGQDWAEQHRSTVVETAKGRLASLEGHLADRPYLMGQSFNAVDILMVTALRFIQHTTLLDGAPHVAGYKARCEKRTAWQKVLADQTQRMAG